MGNDTWRSRVVHLTAGACSREQAPGSKHQEASSRWYEVKEHPSM